MIVFMQNNACGDTVECFDLWCKLFINKFHLKFMLIPLAYRKYRGVSTSILRVSS